MRLAASVLRYNLAAFLVLSHLDMSPRKQGYFFVLVTMCIWGGFTLFARLNAQWHISAWDIAALRFAIAFLILMPILIYKKDLAFLWSKHAVILALIGGVI